MTDDLWRVTVTVTVHKGKYGYGSMVQKEWEMSAPLDVLRRIEIGPSTDKLYVHTLAELLDMAEEKEEGDE